MWASATDPNNVFFLFQIEDSGKAKQFIDDPRAAQAGKTSGVLDGEYHFIEDVPLVD